MKNQFSTIFSIGHGNKSLEEFLEELLAYNIEYLIDVRTTPYSKWNSHFNQNELKVYLKQYKIGYVF